MSTREIRLPDPRRGRFKGTREDRDEDKARRARMCTCCGHRHVMFDELWGAPQQHTKSVVGVHVACLHRDGQPMQPLTQREVDQFAECRALGNFNGHEQPQVAR